MGGVLLALRGATKRRERAQLPAMSSASSVGPIVVKAKRASTRKIVDYRWVNERYPKAGPAGPLPSLAASIVEGPVLSGQQSRQQASHKPKKVGFEDTTLGEDEIRELKCRAERNAQARERRSQSRSREPERPKAEVQPVEPAAPAVEEGLGTVVQLMDAKGTHDEAVRLVRSAEQNVLLLGYSYDLPELQEALVYAASRKVPVKVGLDRRTTLSGKPRDQQQLAQQLDAHRISVVLQKGGPLAPEYLRVGRTLSGTGIQHAKTLLADHTLVVGSTNWTVSSRANSEVGVKIRLHPSGERLVREALESRLEGGERLQAALDAYQPRRGRSKSRHTDTDE